MKKRLFMAAALALAALLLSACGKSGSTGGSDTPYPYKLDKSGTFSILGDTPDGYGWELTDGGDAVAAAGGAFRVALPEEKDAATAAFALQRTGAAYRDELASLTVTFVRESDAAAAVSAYHLTETAPAVSGGEGTETPYHLWVSGDGTALLTIETTQPLWRTDCDPARLSVREDGAAEGLRTYSISAAADAGTAELGVYSYSAAARIDVVFALSESGLTVESHRLSPCSAADSEGYQDFAAAAGDVTLPDGAAPVDYGAEGDRQGGGDDTGIVDFTWQGGRWTLVTTTETAAETLGGEYAAQATGSTGETVRGVQITAYTFDGGAAALWTDAAGRVYCLTGETESLTAVMDAAKAFLADN